jgi:hypothetical protein
VIPGLPGPAEPRGYTRRVPAERIAESLAFINWTVLTALAVGAFAAVVAGRFWTDATKGYIAFTAVSAAVFAVLALAADTGLPPAQDDGVSIGLEMGRRAGLAALAVAGVGYGVAVWRGKWAAPLAVAGLGSALATLIFGAWSLTSGETLVDLALFLVQLIGLAVALGGVWAAMVLGHWYLVTPKLPEAPLVRFARWLTYALAIQLVLSVAWLAFGVGANGLPGFRAMVELPWAFFVWLRLLVGLVFPLIVSWAAIQTARTRSMESATGLLYINVGTIAAGTILAAGLHFGAGLLV